MKVLHLIASRGLYGAEHVVLHLLPALQTMGIDVALGCMSQENTAGSDLGKELEKRNVPVFFIEDTSRVSTGAIYRIWRILRDAGINILHTHGYKATILGGLVARTNGTPLMCTCHGEATKRPDLAAYLAIENFFLRKAAKVFAVSSSIREELVARKVAASRVSIVNNGIIDPVNNGRDRRTANDERRSFPHLICIGRLIKSKRFDLAIEAVHVLRGEYPNILLSIAGDGPCDGDLRSKVKEHDLESRVLFHGFVQDTGRIYDDGDIFLLPSETEGSPIVLIEAMAHGLPIIVAPVGAIPEMVKDGQSALFVKPADAAGIVQAIRTIASDENYRIGLGRAARALFSARFNADTMAYAYATQYRAVFDESRQSRKA